MPKTSPALPTGLRVYAIGDLHGRLDLLEQLLEKIAADRKAYKGESRLIFLGDYIDRGLYSRQVIERLIELPKEEKLPPTFLMGNHEQVIRELLHGGPEKLLSDWLRFGGRETLLSYGLSTGTLMGDLETILAEFKEKMPRPHIAFLDGLTLYAEFGDYFFCHAGVRPGIDLYAQNAQDLIWIRRDFLEHEKPFAKMIVHGHTISPEVEFTKNRINVDTGAYATGCLTALGLEGTRQWLIQTG
jgi:serine/threonine protein phosphatase 1